MGYSCIAMNRVPVEVLTLPNVEINNEKWMTSLLK